MSLKKVSLEISLKPFCFDMTDDGFAATARKIFRQWENLFSGKQLQLMFWTADGSELLDYSGNMDDAFEYARYVGCANFWAHQDPNTPIELQNLHQRNYLFMPNPPVWTYRDLQRLIHTLKSVYTEMYGGILEVGTTFDPGPEFAVSHFKYERHPETLSNMLGAKIFVYCYSTLNADDFHYAAYPNGVPQGTRFGTFIGKQAQCFMTDIGFDFIWFSNGFGFGTETWGMTGAVFDGSRFYPENSHKTSDLVFQFWNDFRRECPKFRIETRGTNLTTGIDLASDAVPLREIYKNVTNLEIPPNSPWAALDHNFGLELVGWMSHIAELPEGKGFPFRYYTHDPWWLNSPWLDRYDRMPHDIYLPMAICRINKKGEAETPTQFDFLSIDDSYGHMPDQVPQECIPHLLDAERTRPDQAGPLVWVYPFDEYHDAVYNGMKLDEVFFGDHQIITAVNLGFPLNTIVSTANFLSAPAETFAGRILVVPTMVRPAVVEHIQRLVAEQGAKAVFYGPVREKAIADMLQMAQAEGIEGEGVLEGYGKIRHQAIYSAGKLDCVLKDDAHATVLANYVIDGVKQPAAVLYGDSVVWIRGTNSFDKVGRMPQFLSADYAMAEQLFIDVLKHLGLQLEYEKPMPQVAPPRIGIRLHDNAFYFSVFGTNSTVRQHIRMTDGAPLFRGRDMILKDNVGIYQTEKWANLEARLFVQGDDSVIECTEWTHENRGMNRRMVIDGLKNATLVFRPTVDDSETVIFKRTTANHTLFAASDCDVEKTQDAFGVKYIARNITGRMTVLWGTKPDLSKW